MRSSRRLCQPSASSKLGWSRAGTGCEIDLSRHLGASPHRRKAPCRHAPALPPPPPPLPALVLLPPLHRHSLFTATPVPLQPPSKAHITQILPHIAGLRTDEQLRQYLQRSRGDTVRSASASFAQLVV